MRNVTHLNRLGQFKQSGSAIRGRLSETRMTAETTQKLALLANQLAENLMTVAICADELRATIRAELDPTEAPPGSALMRRPVSHGPRPPDRPHVDHSTLTLFWQGRSCQLGYTKLFKLADRLSRRPNQFVTFDQLLRDVWNGDLRSPDTIRSAVRNLRQRLIDAGMGQLAAAIQGRAGRYGLILNDDN